MNPKVNTVLGVLLLLSCAFATGYFVWNFSQFNVVTADLSQYQAKPNKGEDVIVCTQEAKLCPDGSYVARSGPHCEFAPCVTSQKQ